MRKKQVLALVMSAAMAAGVLAGCGSSESQASSGASTEGAESADSTASGVDNSEPYEVAISYITTGSDPTDLGRVEDAMSEYCTEKYNCTVSLKPVAISNMTSQYNLWASSGEKIDLICLWRQNMGTMINEGKIICLDEYMNEDILPNVMSVAETDPFLSGGMYNGSQYAIPIVNPSQGEGKAMYAVASYLENVDYEEKDVYSYEDLLSIFSQIKEQYPDVTPWAQQGTLSSTLATNFIDCDVLGTSGAVAGVLLDATSGDTQVVDLFETDEYYEFLEFMQQCYQNGYISSDAATSTDSSNDWIISGRSAGFNIQDDTPGNKDNDIKSWSVDDVVQFNIKDTYVTTSTYSSITWGVSTNSEKPERALQVLDELYAPDATLLNMIMNGIEGEHYITTEGSKIITYPEGVDGTNTPYRNVLGLYGDKRNMYMFAPNEDSFYELSEEYTANALQIQSPALGYTFVSDDYSNEIAQITAVMSEYLSSLEYGMVDDLDSYYQEFISALKDAGIDDVVAANQEQLNAYLEAK